MRSGLTLIGALLLGCSVSLAAQETGEERAFHTNTFALFTGLAHESHRDNEAALGLEYERRLSASFGIGALAEHTFTEEGTWVFAVPFAWHNGPWKAYVAPGIEEHDSDTEELLRVGVEYGFEAGEWEISPQVDVDFVDDETVYVIGLVFGKGF